MSITYFNRRTGDTAVFDQPSRRLEALDNWVRIEEDAPLPSQESDGVLSRPHLQVNNGVRVQNPPDGGPPILEDGTRGNPDTPPAASPEPLHTTEGDNPVGDETAPAENASLEDWRAYATKLASSAEAQADVAGMTRDELIAAYGKDAHPVSTGTDGSRPARSAPKAEWQSYARSQAKDSDEEAAIDGLTKEQLVDKYGGGDH